MDYMGQKWDFNNRIYMGLSKQWWLTIEKIKQITKFSILVKHRELLLPSLPQNLEVIQLHGYKTSFDEWLLSNEQIQP